MKDKPYGEIENPPSKPLEIVHLDIEGPLPTSIDGTSYIVNFVDSYSKLIFTYAMRFKSDTKEMAIRFLSEISPVGQIGTLRSDQGSEYKSMRNWLNKRGIKWQSSVTNTPQQNGEAEATWQILFGMIRAMLYHAKLDIKFWPYTPQYAVQIKNRVITKTQSRFDVTPYELFYGKKPNLAPYRIFGCKCYVWNNRPHKKKFVN